LYKYELSNATSTHIAGKKRFKAFGTAVGFLSSVRTSKNQVWKKEN
jgi:hypothetical protein